MEGFADVPRSSSGHFRSRPTGASHRRVNISVSQSIPALEREGRLGLSGSKTPASSGVEATNTSTIETKSARRGQQFIVFLLVLSCITKFTFDVVLNGISYDTSSLSPLNDLPQGFRLSRISTLYNPEEFYPYAISPKRKSNSPLNITVCLYITLEQLLAADQALSEWPGYISLVLVHPDELSGSSKRGLRSSLKAISRHPSIQSKLHLHLYPYPQRIPPPSNSLRNLARFYSPTQSVALVPSLDILRKLSRYVALREEGGLSPKGTTLIVFNEAATELERSIQNGVFTSGSAVLVDRDQGPWCPERFISSADTQWIHCLWHTWLHSRGGADILMYPSSLGDPIQENMNSPNNRVDILEKIDAIAVPKLRIETCMHLSRNMHALHQKEGRTPSLETQFDWLRQACAEAFSIWGEALF